MTTTPPGEPPASVHFVANTTLIRAIDDAARASGDTRSHYVRKLIADYLRSEGFLTLDAPVTRRAAGRLAGAAHV